MAKKTVKFENKKGKVKEIVVHYKSEDNYFDDMSTIGMKSANRRFERENGSVKENKSYVVESLMVAILVVLALIILPAKMISIVFGSAVVLIAGLFLGKFLFKVVSTTISNVIYTNQLQEYNEWKMKYGKESL